MIITHDFNSCLHVLGLEYIKTAVPNHAYEAVSGPNDDNTFFVTNKRSTSSPLECYLASDNASVSWKCCTFEEFTSKSQQLHYLLAPLPASSTTCGSLVLGEHRTHLTDDILSPVYY